MLLVHLPISLLSRPGLWGERASNKTLFQKTKKNTHSFHLWALRGEGTDAIGNEVNKDIGFTQYKRYKQGPIAALCDKNTHSQVHNESKRNTDRREKEQPLRVQELTIHISKRC